MRPAFTFPFYLLFFGLFSTFATEAFSSPTADQLINKRGFKWSSAASGQLHLFYEKGSYAELRIADLKSRQDIAFDRNLRLLDLSEYTRQIDIFIVDSRERMNALIGEKTNGVAYPVTNVACFVYSRSIDASGSHELMHVMAANSWGRSSKVWINEGFAGYADDIWHGYKLHDLGRFLLQNNHLLPVSDLISSFSKRPHLLTYPQSASFVMFLYERHGPRAFRALWADATAKGLKRATGKDIQSLEKEWYRELKNADATNIRYDITRGRQ